MSLEGMSEFKFKSHLEGVVSYVKGIKEREPGWNYDNFAEYAALVEKHKSLETEDIYIREMMDLLNEEIQNAKQLQENPVRSPEEEAFYKKIVGINSYIQNTKENQPHYIFDNVNEVEGLLREVGQLNTQDPDILSVLDFITKDIKVILAKNDLNQAVEYDERLKSLGIGVSKEELENNPAAAKLLGEVENNKKLR